MRPSAAVSADSGSESASSRTLRQCAQRLGRVAGARPGGGARVPARRLERLAGRLPVLGEQRRALVEPLRVLLGDRPRDRRVDRGAALAELRAVGHLLGQRVLERVDAPPGRAPARRRTRPRPGSRSASSSSARLELDDPREHRLGELLADHRRRLQHRLLALREPVDARREDGLHGRRHRRLLDRRARAGRRRARPRGCPSSTSDWTTSSMKNGLPPVRSRISSGEPVERRVGAEQVAEQLARSPRGRAGRAAIWR